MTERTNTPLYHYQGDRFFRNALALHADRLVHDTDERPHDHDFLEVAVVTGGTATHVTARGRRQVGPGFVAVLRPGAWHAYVRPGALEGYNVLVGPGLLRRELAWMRDEPALNHLLWSGPLGLDRDGVITVQLPADRLADCGTLVTDLIAALPHRSADAVHRRPRALARLVLLLDELAAHMGPEHRAAVERTKPAPAAVIKALDLLEHQPSFAWTTSELAGRVRLSGAHLIRQFKAATGLPPLAYLSRLRAERAAGLLLRTDLPVARVGEQVGWPSPWYFARRFKLHFGLSATEYRGRFARPA